MRSISSRHTGELFKEEEEEKKDMFDSFFLSFFPMKP